MDPPSNTGILTRASRRNRRSTITGLANTPLGKSRRETLIGERIITNSSSNNHPVSDLGSASRIAPSLVTEKSNDTSKTTAEMGKENIAVEDYLQPGPGSNIRAAEEKLGTIQSSNENTGTGNSKRAMHEEFQLDNTISNNKRRKINENNKEELKDGTKSKRYLNNQINHSHFNDLPMLDGLVDDDDDEEDVSGDINYSVTNSKFHSAIKNRVLDKFAENNNHASSPKTGEGDGFNEPGKTRNRDVEVAELKRSNELLTIKLATYLEDFKKIDTNGAMEEQFNKLVKWKHNYQKVTQEMNHWKLKCEEVERDLKVINDNPSLANKEKFTKLEQEISNLREENKKLQDSVLDVSKERNEFKDECDAIRYQKDTLEREKNSIAMTLTSAENKIKVMDSDLKGKNVQIDGLNNELKSLREELDSFRKKYADVLENINSLKESNVEKDKFAYDLKLKNEEISVFEKKIDEMKKALKNLENEKVLDNENFTVTINKLNKTVVDYKTLLDEKALELKKLATQYAELEVESEFKINKLTRELESERANADDAKASTSNMSLQVKTLQTQLNGLKQEQAERHTLSLRCKELEKGIESKTYNLKLVEEEKSKLLAEIFDLKEKIEEQNRNALLNERNDRISGGVSFASVNSGEITNLKVENEQLNKKIAQLNNRLKTQNVQFSNEIDVLQANLSKANAKLTENLKDYVKLEDELLAVNEEKDKLTVKLQNIDRQTAQKMGELLDENNQLKLDINKFSKTALKYQNENTLLKDDLVALEKNLNKFKNSKRFVEEDLELLKMQKEKEIRSIKSQYIQEMRNLQEENLQLTENLTMFKNSLSSKSRMYSERSGNNQRDDLINNLHSQLKYFKNKYSQEVDKNKDLQIMNEHYRKLVNQSTTDLRMGRLQNLGAKDKRTFGEDGFSFFNDSKRGNSSENYKYTSSEFNI